MKYSKLRIAWLVAWGVGAVLLAALWVRSYWWMESVNWSAVGLRTVMNTSEDGGIGVIVTDLRIAGPSAYARPPAASQLQRRWMFARSLGKIDMVVAFPHWVPTIIFGAVGAAPWLPWRFSLRTLLIVTTLVAVGVGLIVWLTK
jgi:hypothetical protein